MKKIIYAILALVAVTFVVGCDDTETYADQKDKERAAVTRFIADSSITVISEAQFKAKDYTTDVSKREFVLFENTGVYMQIVRKGCGSKLKSGETATVLCRFSERNIMTDSLQLSNLVPYFSSIVEKMTVTRTGDVFTASFDSNSSLMAAAYSSVAVPSGWLVPMSYINVGRPENPGDEIAKVKLIVPHSQGQAYATQSVYPCYYEITYQKGR